jgi:DNA sulfur modification protein DndE
MLPKRLRISHTATETLKLLKVRTGVTPNIICRMALLISLEKGAGGGQAEPEQSGSEFNAVTLFGEFSSLFDVLIIEVHGPLTTKEKICKLVSHIDDGLATLRKSRNLLELVSHSGLDGLT